MKKTPASFALAIVLLSLALHSAEPQVIKFKLDQLSRVSCSVFSDDGEVQLRALIVGEWLAAGPHEVSWDGLDRNGAALPAGKYVWKLISSPGLEADYLGALGVNPIAGGWTKWVGNHIGPTTIAVNQHGICIGCQTCEGPPHIMMLEPDAATQRWHYPPLGWDAYGPVALALTDAGAVYVRQDGKVMIRDLKTGAMIKEFDALWAGDKRPDELGGRLMDLDGTGNTLVISHFDHDAVRWYDMKTGAVTREVNVPQPRRVAVRADGGIYALSQGAVVHIGTDNKQSTIVDAKQLIAPAAMSWDPADESILVANGAPDHRIRRFSPRGELLATYGVEGGRKPGPYFPDRFTEVVDIAGYQGEFYVVEGNSPYHNNRNKFGGGLRRIVKLSKDGKILHEWYGGVPFFTIAAATPGNPHEVFQSISDATIARYDFDPDTGASKLTHLFTMPEKRWGDGLFPTPYDFPHYRPVKFRGQLYLVSNGRFVLRPDFEKGELIPVALASYKPNNGWKAGAIPQPILDAAAFHKLDLNSTKTDAFTWSDTNGNGKLDPEEFRFAETGPGAGYGFIDKDFNVYFGYYFAPNHTYTGKNWINWEFKKSLYARLPNEAREGAVPVWNWDNVVRSEEKIPEDPLNIYKRYSPRTIHVTDSGQVSVFFLNGGGDHLDSHPDPWPTAQTSNTRLITAAKGRVTQVLGKHNSEGPPEESQFHFPSHLLGTVGTNLVVCDRMKFTTAYTQDGLLIGTLLDRHVKDEVPEVHYTPAGKDGETSVLAGDDWMSAGSICDLGNGEAVWFAASGDRAMVYKIRGWNKIKHQKGSLKIKEPMPAAKPDGEGLHAEYFANADLSGKPVIERTDPRLWFTEATTGGQIVGAWSKNGPGSGIAAGEPFSVRWTGTLSAPYSEPFWLRIYNDRIGNGFTPNVQTWKEGRGFARVYLNNQLVLDKWKDSPATHPWQTAPLMLQAGKNYDLRIEYAHAGGAGAQFSFSWCSYTTEWMRVPTQYLHAKPAEPQPRVSVSAVQAAASEQGETPGIVRFTLDQPAAKDIAIAYRIDGTATPDDFTLPERNVVIRAGQRSADLTIKPVDDALLEANETVVVTLTPSPDYFGDGSAGSATITISDNDNVLLDDSLKLYYTFDAIDMKKYVIRNQVGPDFSAYIEHYGRIAAQPEPSMNGYGEALTFMRGNESVRSKGKLEMNDYTIAFWFKTNLATTGICMSPTANFSLEEGRFKVINSGWPVVQPAGANLADGQWHHAAFVWNPPERQQRLYVDGERVAVAGGPTGGLSGQMSLGYANSGGSFKGGSIDELRVYARQLTDAEIKTLARWRR